jgi:mitochondrial chaperone BCS1
MNAFNGASLIQPFPSQLSIIDIFFPGFTTVSASARELVNGNISFGRLLCIGGLLIFLAHYTFRYFGELVDRYFSL